MLQQHCEVSTIGNYLGGIEVEGKGFRGVGAQLSSGSRALEHTTRTQLKLGRRIIIVYESSSLHHSYVLHTIHAQVNNSKYWELL